MADGENFGAKFSIDISDLKAGLSQANRLIKESNSEFKKAAAGLGDWTQKEDGLVAKKKQLTDTLQIQNTVLDAYKKQLEEAGYAENDMSKEAVELRTKINNQEAAVKNTEKALEDTEAALKDLKNSSNEAGDAMDDMSNVAEDTSGGFTIMKGALAELVADGFKACISIMKDWAGEASDAYNKFQAATGATTEEMAGFKEEIKDLYNQNFGESLEDIGDKMAYVKQVTGETDPSKIKELAKNAMALEDTFGSDFNETIRGVSNMTEHFGITAEEAFNLIAQGSQNGLDYTDELGDNIAEYGGNFAQAGYSAEEYFQLLENGTQGGAYNLDKVNDSINEVKNRLGDGSIEKSISTFSKETQTAFKNWQDGKGTMKDVVNSIVGDITNCKDEQEALTMASTAFGTMGEDANLDVVKSLTTLGDSYKDVEGKMDEVNNVRYDGITSALSSLGRTFKTELVQPILDVVEPVIEDFVGFIEDHMEIAIPIVAGLATAFGVLAGALAIQGLINGVSKAIAFLNTTMLANPIVLIVAAIAGLVVAFITLWKKSEEFRNFWIGLWEGIKAAASAVWDVITSVASGAWEGIKIAWSAVTGFFSGIFNGIKNVATKVWSGITGTIKTAVGTVKNAWSSITSFFSGLWNGISEGATTAFNAVVGVVKTVIEKVQGLWSGLSTFASGVVSGITGAWNTMVDSLKKVVNTVISGINGAIGIINKIPGVSIDRIKPLAKGGIVTSATNAIIGEDGAEAVVPLERNTEWIDKLAESIIKATGGSGTGAGVIVNQTNNYSQAHSRYEIYKSKQQTAAAVRLALRGAY